jgi:exopolysaccharide production protein ExoQ
MPNPLPRTAGPAATRAPRKPVTSFAARVATVIYWLLIIRLIIPGRFDYGDDIDILKIAERDAVFNKVTWLTFLFVPLLLLAARSNATMRIVRATNPYFLALIGFATISVAWSIDTGASASRVVHMLTIMACCLAVTVTAWHPARLQEVTRPVLMVLLLGSLIFGLYAPELAVTPPTPPDIKGYWHGLTTQKNQLGSLASFCSVLWIHGWAARETKLIPTLFGAGISIALLVLARSSTAIMATALVAMLMTMMLRSLPPSLRRYMPYMIGLFVILTLTYSLAVLKILPGTDILLKPITLLTGKDTTFTARTQIWDIIKMHIQSSPLIGSGYGGYWVGPVPTSQSYAFVQLMNGFYPTEAHNGYLDLINDLGYVGLLLLVGYLITYIRRSLQLLRVNYAQATLYLGLMFQQLLTNLAESHWFVLSADFVILSLATFGLARTLLEAVPSSRSAPAVARKRLDTRSMAR